MFFSQPNHRMTTKTTTNTFVSFISGVTVMVLLLIGATSTITAVDAFTTVSYPVITRPTIRTESHVIVGGVTLSAMKRRTTFLSSSMMMKNDKNNYINNSRHQNLFRLLARKSSTINKNEDTPPPLITSSRNNDMSSSSSSSPQLESFLRVCELTHAAVSIEMTNDDPPPTNDDVIIAEIFANGQMELVIFTKLIPNEKSSSSPPLIEVARWDSSTYDVDYRIIDIGQVTTIWTDNSSSSSSRHHLMLYSPIPTSLLQQHLRHLNGITNNHNHRPPNLLPSSRLDHNIQELYHHHVLRPPLTKSQIKQLSQRLTRDIGNDNPFLTILPLLKKSGRGYSRLISSSSLDTPSRRSAAEALASELLLGGRFKRFSIIPLPSSSSVSSTSPSVLHCLNGGYIPLDKTTRSMTEGRQLASRKQIVTEADERIAWRLECLAMGDALSPSSSSASDEERWEVDARETLLGMGLDVTPGGAKEALIQLGLWTSNTSPTKTNVVDPWSPAIINATTSLSSYATRPYHHPSEKRTDLRRLPFVTIDAKGTSFRDDGIGLRPRSATGREVVGNNKWEVLVHIADVSDVFGVEEIVEEGMGWDGEKRELLRRAASRRGLSRYDLPGGPLHLLPPRALSALALTTAPPPSTDNTPSPKQQNTKNNIINRCVTVYAYIDTSTGQLLDSGIERTLLGPPLATLTYDTATSLLSSPSNPDQKLIHTLLTITERHLQSWQKRYHSTNKLARDRHSRLSIKTKIASATFQKFQRTRAHALVDAAIELYSHTASQTLRRSQVPIPRSSGGAGREGRGRVGTAPLRRYVDGMVQRQLIAVLLLDEKDDRRRGLLLTKRDCDEINTEMNRAMVALERYKSVTTTTTTTGRGKGKRRGRGQTMALLKLDGYLSQLSQKNRQSKYDIILEGMATGKENEVVLMGLGAVGKCMGVKGTLRPGGEVKVEVVRLDLKKGVLSLRLVV